MIVYSLSGASGTGKSTSALQFAYEHQIEGIIDDGILIVNGEKRAGTSAKFEKNTVTAVRRAIFDESTHREAVKKAITEANLTSILLIGTSDKMTKKIAKHLDIEPITYFYYVQDIRSPREIKMARFVRETKGQHVMPIPYRQVEQNFFKRFIKKGREIFTSNRVKLGETTIVRPDFHHETINISKRVYHDVLQHETQQQKFVARIDSLQVDLSTVPTVKLVIYIKAPLDYEVIKEIQQLQILLVGAFIKTFMIEPEVINIEVKGIHK
ncbi:hypothetical protein [Solibacillus sp. CAU 1738]|uniref:hypothetical protein n=1 Tax=Solibacillus sp. CAU 1738 TaxID=3140363 RepID=UPI0032616060